MQIRSIDRIGQAFAVFTIILLMLAFVSDAWAQRPRRVQRSVRPPEINAQFHRAETAWRSGTSLLEAKARIDRVIEAMPDDSEALKLRAGILISMGQHAEAFDDAVRSSSLDPDDGEAQLLLCEASVFVEQDEVGLLALKGAEDLLMERHDLHIRLSKCAMGLTRLDEAAAYARIALAADELNAEAYMQLARVFALNKETENAITILLQGLSAGVLQPNQIRSEPAFRYVVEDARIEAALWSR